MTISRADLIILTMHDALLRELQEGLARGGPRSAMAACHSNSAAVSWRLARGEGIASGRTSDRLRNPTNAAPPWAAPLVEANAGRPARDVDGFAVDLGSKVGVLRPIVLQPMCTGCHGPADHISPEVRQVLADRYPRDQQRASRREKSAAGDLGGDAEAALRNDRARRTCESERWPDPGLQRR